MCRRNRLSRRGFKIHNIQSLIRRGDYRVALLPQIVEPAQKVFFLGQLGAEKIRKAARKNAGAGNQRAGAKHFEKFSSSSEPVGRGVHTHSSSALLAYFGCEV